MSHIRLAFYFPQLSLTCPSEKTERRRHCPADSHAALRAATKRYATLLLRVYTHPNQPQSRHKSYTNPLGNIKNEGIYKM
tara:strand:+ start:472 stop:711 length:240 start_codon:yes stop_codon:yes gene_type:complete